jgi:hypothetical protein
MEAVQDFLVAVTAAMAIIILLLLFLSSFTTDTARDLVLHLANKPFLALTLRAAPVLLLVAPTLRLPLPTDTATTATARDLVLHLANKPFLALTLRAAPVLLLVAPTLCLTLALIFLASIVQSVLNLVHDSCHWVFLSSFLSL